MPPEPELLKVLLVGAFILIMVWFLPLRLLRARIRLRHVAKRTGPDPQHNPQAPERMDPAALAHLEGGPERVGEVAVVSALLDGRITPHGAPPGHVRRVGPDHHASDDVVRAPLLRAFRTSGGGSELRPVSVRDLVEAVQNSSIIDRIAASLGFHGYTATGPDTERDRQALVGGERDALLWIGISMVLFVLGVIKTWGIPDIDETLVFAGLAGEGVAIGTLLAMPNKEQIRRYAETPAARQLLRQARATYRDIGGKKVERPWGRDEVLWHTAVTGFRGMRDRHRPMVVSRPARPGQGHGRPGAAQAAYGAVGPGGSGRPGGTGGSGGPGGPEEVVALRVGPHTPDLLWGVAGAGLARHLAGDRGTEKEGYSFEVEVDAVIDGVRWDEPFGGGFGDVSDGDGDGDGGGDGGDGGGGGGD